MSTKLFTEANPIHPAAEAALTDQPDMGGKRICFK
jgi:hypothetical protein